MSGTRIQPSSEAVSLAKTIVAIPAGEVPAVIRKMILQRKLSRTVIVLDDLLQKHPEHEQVAAKALDKLGLWHAG